MPLSEITRREAEATPILFIQRQVAPAELQGVFAECFPQIFGHCMQAGHAIAGHPMARYISAEEPLFTVDCIIPLQQAAPGEGEIQAGTLQAGPVAFATHSGPYEGLGQSYDAIERWIADNGLTKNGAAWEWYITDPGDEPDPAKWATEIYWPITP